MLKRRTSALLPITFDGMKSWGLKQINFRTATMIINSTNLRETTHAPIFYTVCVCPVFIQILCTILTTKTQH